MLLGCVACSILCSLLDPKGGMVSSQHIKRGLGRLNFAIAFATSLTVSSWANIMISVPPGLHPSHGNRETEQRGQVRGRRRTSADVSLSNPCGSSGEMTPLTEAKMRSWWFSGPGCWRLRQCLQHPSRFLSGPRAVPWMVTETCLSAPSACYLSCVSAFVLSPFIALAKGAGFPRGPCDLTASPRAALGFHLPYFSQVLPCGL